MDFLGVKQYVLDRLERELPTEYVYHSIEHTLDVLQASGEICENEGVEGKERLLVETAALLHDIGFIYGPTEHEERGCEIAEVILPSFGYRPDEIERICSMIRATKIPQSPKDHLEMILCDADLDYLGRGDFIEIGNRLFSELQFLGRIEGKVAWNRLQIAFLGAQRYWTKTNQERRSKRLAENLSSILKIVE